MCGDGEDGEERGYICDVDDHKDDENMTMIAMRLLLLPPSSPPILIVLTRHRSL